MPARLDKSVGQELVKLRESGTAEHTLAVFLSDYGGPTKEHASSNAPLRGGKGLLQGERVPQITKH